MAWGRGSELDFPLRLPANVKLVSVVGFPLLDRLSTRALRRYHRRLQPRGPNDGLLLLADPCGLPGLVYPVWGADHNLRPRCGLGRLVAALAFGIAELLDLWKIDTDSRDSPCVSLGEDAHGLAARTTGA